MQLTRIRPGPDWLIVDLALQAYGKVSVPLYDTLGADSVEHVTNHSELTIIFAAPEHIPHLLTVAQDDCIYREPQRRGEVRFYRDDLVYLGEPAMISVSDVVIEVWNRERLAYLKV
ncbi:hypothetical protein NUW54_g12023 [Trametes sanguinea]|uniref:Uncharacterized protein n=1 Tax=Trametes sanguinea TaxID=158606 RepID=A0ACC1N431_9APHY|nr:hypothetical protein NUW54_g12023 [Trametes sanguinea]